jgi:thiamine transporter
MKKRANIEVLAETGILVAIAIALDYVFGLFSPFRYGGSISPAMLPIFLLAYRRGWKAGIIGGLAMGILSSLLNLYYLNPLQYALDYPLAFGVLGIAGFMKGARRKPWPFIAGILAGSFLRYLCHGFSGYYWFVAYPDIATDVTSNWWLYSFILYNLPYMAASAAFCVAIGLILQRRGILETNLEGRS